jgi:DNA-directed RNA polymerase specialized sigma24 family protein
MTAVDQGLPQTSGLRRDEMKAPDEVSAMIRLKELGWGAKRIAAEPGCSKNTVRRWLAQGAWRPCTSPSRS